MSDAADNDNAEEWFKKAKEYNWRGTEAANAALSWAAFERAARLGHAGAMRELAEMMFVGSGGPKDEEQAFWLKLTAYRHNDDQAMDELIDLLESYAESGVDSNIQSGAMNAVRKAKEAQQNLSELESFIRDQRVRKKRMDLSK